MSVRRAFESKIAREKLYAHHLARYGILIRMWDTVYLISVFAEQLGMELESYCVKSHPNQQPSLILLLNCIQRVKGIGTLSPHRQECRQRTWNSSLNTPQCSLAT